MLPPSFFLYVKVRAAAVSGKAAVVRAWAQEAKAKGASLDLGDANDRTVLHLAAKG